MSYGPSSMRIVNIQKLWHIFHDVPECEVKIFGIFMNILIIYSHVYVHLSATPTIYYIQGRPMSFTQNQGKMYLEHLE